MLTKTLPQPRKSRTACHCCRKPVPAATLWDNQTLHGMQCCSPDCRETVDNSILNDPPELVRELVGVE
jgi:hypothetical protein